MGDIPIGNLVQVKWGDDQDLFTARVTGRRISVTYQVCTGIHVYPAKRKFKCYDNVKIKRKIEIYGDNLTVGHSEA